MTNGSKECMEFIMISLIQSTIGRCCTVIFKSEWPLISINVIRNVPTRSRYKSPVAMTKRKSVNRLITKSITIIEHCPKQINQLLLNYTALLSILLSAFSFLLSAIIISSVIEFLIKSKRFDDPLFQ